MKNIIGLFLLVSVTNCIAMHHPDDSAIVAKERHHKDPTKKEKKSRKNIKQEDTKEAKKDSKIERRPGSSILRLSSIPTGEDETLETTVQKSMNSLRRSLHHPEDPTHFLKICDTYITFTEHSDPTAVHTAWKNPNNRFLCLAIAEVQKIKSEKKYEKALDLEETEGILETRSNAYDRWIHATASYRMMEDLERQQLKR